MGLFDFFKKSKKDDATPTTGAAGIQKPAEQQNTQDVQERVINDRPFVKEIKHLQQGSWHQYDVLIDARPYGWLGLLEMADKIVENDWYDISEIQAGTMGAGVTDFLTQFSEAQSLQKVFAEHECGFLSVAGISKRLKAPLKIVWFNQSRVLRCFTFISDERLIEKYCETALRGIWGSEDEMCLARNSD